DRNRSHWSTSKTPSYTKSVSWQHHRIVYYLPVINNILMAMGLWQVTGDNKVTCHTYFTGQRGSLYFCYQYGNCRKFACGFNGSHARYHYP
ncbi:hypothetical protein ACOY9F_13455, partial [Citrobacter portucalensis]